jgi:hypothetical protein
VSCAASSGVYGDRQHAREEEVAMQHSGSTYARFRLSILGAAGALASLGGCWEAQPPPAADPRLVAEVQVSRREPLGCWPLGAVSGRGSEHDGEAVDYQAAYDDVRNKAALRGGNLVVIDAVGQPRMLSHSVAVFDYSIAGRLFRCPSGGYDSAPSRAEEAPPSSNASCGGQCCNAEE